MPETSKAGFSWKLYRNTGTHASPTWTLITRTRDLTINIGAEDIDDSTRASRFKKSLAGMVELGISGQFKYNAGNADHTYLIAAMLAGTVFEVACVDGAIATSGTQGLRMFAVLTQYNLSLPLSDNTLVDIELKPAFKEEAAAEVDPDWYVVP